jgi:hypothetical protein
MKTVCLARVSPDRRSRGSGNPVAFVILTRLALPGKRSRRRHRRLAAGPVHQQLVHQPVALPGAARDLHVHVSREQSRRTRRLPGHHCQLGIHPAMDCPTLAQTVRSGLFRGRADGASRRERKRHPQRGALPGRCRQQPFQASGPPARGFLSSWSAGRHVLGDALRRKYRQRQLRSNLRGEAARTRRAIRRAFSLWAFAIGVARPLSPRDFLLGRHRLQRSRETIPAARSIWA